MKSKNQRNYENLNKCIFPGIGRFGIPQILPEQFDGCDGFIGFNYAATCKDRVRKGLHFYLDDYQFFRVWNRPDYYLPLLKQFKWVMTPDFSTYVDFPLAIQIYNHYRKHWLGAYFQKQGIKVIPTISWSDKTSYEWCFDGEPIQGIVSVSAVGTQMNNHCKELFLSGFFEMIERLQPTGIIFYGDIPTECHGSNVMQISSFQNKWKEESHDGG